MFPFFSKDNSVLVQPLYSNGNSLAFACETLLDPDQDLTVRDREGHQAEVQVQDRRRADDQSWIYFAVLLDGALEPEWPNPGYQWRQNPRFAVGVRVRSPQLPEYSALTEDLSPDGAQLQTYGPLRVGEEIELYLDLDSGFPEVKVLARVCWTRMTQPWKAGVAFLDMGVEERAILRNYLLERTGQAVLPGLLGDEPEAPAQEPCVLEKLALLQSSFDDGDDLILKLLTHDEVMEIRFSNPRVLQSNLATQLVGQIVSKPSADGQTNTWLLGPDGGIIVEIQSGSPEIVCRRLKVHDLS